ncbi:MAG: 50S ribosomal protein L13 [candidate division WS6 bacterium OLB20]|uniref:Large ribosomal subunit protein uL13 n=1 Tax=candidate division WS6 bacterium OLB20 TaxID=1617426 RepID=A0A136LX78_9BACT|nr:MAG: 50S ribosomal protein L13 [candidate division WS6 bacterium OLB20]
MKHTRSIKKDELTRNWFIIDAKGVRLGKIATEAARLLIGKHKVTKADNMVSGDSVIIINAKEVDVHPKKYLQKKYYNHSGYIGGMRVETLEQVLAKHPERVIERAVKGMLPKTKLGRAMYGNLYVYEGAEHKHEAQQPISVEIS